MTPELTIRQAAEATGLSIKTIRRRLAEFPNARRDGDGPAAPWTIPVTDLIAAGLTVEDNDTSGKVERPASSPVALPARPAEPDEVEKLRGEVTELRRRAEVAEALAIERERALVDVRLALRALTATTPSTDAASASQSPPEAPSTTSGATTPDGLGSSLLGRLRGRFSR
jgi:hypothetical protein